jgi:hypothetical protein
MNATSILIRYAPRSPQGALQMVASRELKRHHEIALEIKLHIAVESMAL